MDALFPSHLAHIKENVKTFSPESNSVTTTTGRTIGYESLVVATGLQINWGGIQGLPKALADPSSGVSSIYAYETCDKVWNDIDALRTGTAVFTQPAGVVKCAGGTHTHCPRLPAASASAHASSPPTQRRRRSCGWPGTATTGPGAETMSASISTRAPPRCLA